MNDRVETTNDATRLVWTYKELSRIQNSRTAELQNQQQRVATVLVANNFLLGLLANHALGNGKLNSEVGVELASIIVLAVAVVFGLLALWPRIPPQGVLPDSDVEHGKRRTLSEPLARWVSRRVLPERGVEDAERPDLFLDADYFLQSVMDEGEGEADTLKTLCKALRRNITQSMYLETIILRRCFLQIQLALIAIGVVLLGIAAGIGFRR